MLRYILSTAVLLSAVGSGEFTNILAIFPFPARSHFISFSPLLEELANRGHQMTVVTAFPRKTTLKNYKDIVIKDFLATGDVNMNMFEMFEPNILTIMESIRTVAEQNCEHFFNEPNIKTLINSNEEQFDLIIYEPFFTECAYGFIHKFKAPFILISSNTISQWMGDGVGNPFDYSYMPEVLLGYSHQMSFKERMVNTFVETAFEISRHWIYLPKMEAIMKKHFKDPALPSIHEIETNASFLLLNSHVSFNYPRPLTPNTAEVGGMHLKESKGLPKDLQKLLDEANDGVVYFSLGTNVRSEHMPQGMRNTILKSFSKLKQEVLWKWEADTLPGQPKNVHLRKWFPQSDILAHPNVRAFITHGGLLSTQEATYFGIPLIAIPIMADQKHNSEKAAGQGFAIVLNHKTFSEEEFDKALAEILTNSQYRENAQFLSSIFRDQLEKPLDRAVFWTEYVIRHKGAPHMRSAALNLNFFQYHLLDVMTAIVLIASVIIAISVSLCRILFRRLFAKAKYPTEKKIN